MPKIPECNSLGSLCHRCEYFSHSPYIVCAVNSSGPESETCDDFKATAQSDIETERQLLGGGYYANDWIPKPFPDMSAMERLVLLDWHPQFTGRCPNLEMPIAASLENQWKCEYCNWEDAPRP